MLLKKICSLISLKFEAAITWKADKREIDANWSRGLRDWVDKRASVGLRTDWIKINWIDVFLNHFFKLLARSGKKSEYIETKKRILHRCFPDKPTSSYMGSSAQDGENEQYLSYFFFFGALLWPNGLIFWSFVNCSEEILSVAV